MEYFMRAIIDREPKIDEETKIERELTVFQNRLCLAGERAKDINSKSMVVAAEIADVFREEISKAANNGGDVDFGNFIRSATKIIERNAKPIISKIS